VCATEMSKQKYNK